MKKEDKFIMWLEERIAYFQKHSMYPAFNLNQMELDYKECLKKYTELKEDSNGR